MASDKVGQTNYERLFGTPEKAAETLDKMELDHYNWCWKTRENPDACLLCPYEFDRYGCGLPEGTSLRDWLFEESHGTGEEPAEGADS